MATTVDTENEDDELERGCREEMKGELSATQFNNSGGTRAMIEEVVPIEKDGEIEYLDVKGRLEGGNTFTERMVFPEAHMISYRYVALCKEVGVSVGEPTLLEGEEHNAIYNREWEWDLPMDEYARDIYDEKGELSKRDVVVGSIMIGTIIVLCILFWIFIGIPFFI